MCTLNFPYFDRTLFDVTGEEQSAGSKRNEDTKLPLDSNFNLTRKSNAGPEPAVALN